MKAFETSARLELNRLKSLQRAPTVPTPRTQAMSSSGEPHAGSHQVRSKSLIQKECFAVAVVLPFAEPGGVLAQRHPEFGGRLKIAGRLASGRDKERAAGGQFRSKTLAMRPVEIKQRATGMGVVAIGGKLRR